MSANGSAHSSLTPGHFLFTSESVGEGHPGEPQRGHSISAIARHAHVVWFVDKICDQVSDAIVRSVLPFAWRLVHEAEIEANTYPFSSTPLSSMPALSKTRSPRSPAKLPPKPE